MTEPELPEHVATNRAYWDEQGRRTADTIARPAADIQVANLGQLLEQLQELAAGVYILGER